MFRAHIKDTHTSTAAFGRVGTNQEPVGIFGRRDIGVTGSIQCVFQKATSAADRRPQPRGFSAEEIKSARIVKAFFFLSQEVRDDVNKARVGGAKAERKTLGSSSILQSKGLTLLHLEPQHRCWTGPGPTEAARVINALFFLSFFKNRKQRGGTWYQ